MLKSFDSSFALSCMAPQAIPKDLPAQHRREAVEQRDGMSMLDAAERPEEYDEAARQFERDVVDRRSPVYFGVIKK